jgi:hypothetical protein
VQRTDAWWLGLALVEADSAVGATLSRTDGEVARDLTIRAK